MLPLGHRIRSAFSLKTIVSAAFFWSLCSCCFLPSPTGRPIFSLPSGPLRCLFFLRFFACTRLFRCCFFFTFFTSIQWTIVCFIFVYFPSCCFFLNYFVFGSLVFKTKAWNLICVHALSGESHLVRVSFLSFSFSFSPLSLSPCFFLTRSVLVQMSPRRIMRTKMHPHDTTTKLSPNKMIRPGGLREAIK